VGTPGRGKEKQQGRGHGEENWGPEKKGRLEEKAWHKVCGGWGEEFIGERGEGDATW